MKPGYKQTEVGVIPEEWECATIGGVFNITAGGDVDPKRSQTYQDERHPHPIYSNALTNRGLYGYCSYADHPVDSITVTARGMVGAANFRDHAYTAIGRVLVLQPYKEIAGIYFSEVINNRVNFANESTGVPQLTAPQISKYHLPVPSLPEQRAIAAALSDVDGLLGALDRLIAKKRDLKQAAMQQLLTGQTRLPGFKGEWEVKTVAELEKLKLVKLSRGQVISKKDIEKTPGECPIYSSSIHNDGLFGRYGDFMFDEELITWSVDGGGNFFHRRKHKFSVTNVCGFMRVDTSRIDYRFFAAELQLLHSRKSFDYQSKAHPSVVRKEYEVQLPPLPEQTAIASVLSEMDAELAGLEQRRQKTHALKQGMMQELLTGRTRLV